MTLLSRVRAAAGTAMAGGLSPSVGGGGAGARGFDHVELPASGDAAAKARLTRQQFEALPLQERVGLLVQGTLRFYRGGAEVPASEAMRAAF